MMKTMTKNRIRLFALLLIAPAWFIACGPGGGSEIDVRTFALEYLTPGEAATLVEPYVYREREVAPGNLSVMDGAISVRETSDNLDEIARVLERFDQPSPDLRLHFQLIEADGFTDRDPRIAEVESELRELLQFEGYRLAAEGFVSSADANEVQIELRAADGEMYYIQGTIYRLTSSAIRLDEIQLWRGGSDRILQTTVNIRPEQVLILGSSPLEGSTATLFLTVRAEEGDGPA